MPIRRDWAHGRICQELHKLIETRRSNGGIYINLEARIAAKISKLNTLGSSVALSEAMEALYLLGFANFDSAQRIDILAAASPHSTALLTIFC